MNSLNEFVDYVWSFYGEHDDTLYPIKGLTKQDIVEDGFSLLLIPLQQGVRTIQPLQS